LARASLVPFSAGALLGLAGAASHASMRIAPCTEATKAAGQVMFPVFSFLFWMVDEMLSIRS
jgi:hypothetical protein